jgi:hypothetical protein
MRVRSIAGVLALLILAVGCGTPPADRVDGGTDPVLPSLPADWRTFTRTELALPSPNVGANDPIVLAVGFSADPEATPNEVRNFLRQDAPAGVLLVFELTEDERDRASIESLRNRLLPIDALLEEDPNAIVSHVQQPVEGDGVRGEQVVITVRSTNTVAAPYEESMTFVQTAYVTDDDTHQFFLIVGCHTQCYIDNQDVIEEIATTWHPTN